MKHQLSQAYRGSKTALLLPELKYKYLPFKPSWLQRVSLSCREKGGWRRVGRPEVWECPRLKQMHCELCSCKTQTHSHLSQKGIVSG